LGWTIEFSEAALRQLAKLDKPGARRIVDFMEQRVATLDDPRTLGESLKGPRLSDF
jgi:mRNA interferase RelE/StbE